MKTKNKYVDKMMETHKIQFSEVEINLQKRKQESLAHKTKKEWDDLEYKIKNDIEDFLDKNKSTNFDLTKYMEIEGIKENYPLNVFVSKRGIGKTVSSKKLCEEYAKERKGHFIWLRSTQAEADQFMNDEMTQWFKDNNWYCMNATGIIFRSRSHYLSFSKKNKISASTERTIIRMTPKEKDKYFDNLKFEKIDEEVVGYVEGLFSAAKRNRSMEKRGTRLIIYDEFQLWKKTRDQLKMLSDYTETVVRRKKDFHLILHANYQNANNPLITNLQTSHERIDFNRYMGSIIISIPKEYFNVEKGYITIAERMSFANRETFMARSGDTYSVEPNKQIILLPIDVKEEINPFAYIIHKESTFNIFTYGKDKLIISDDGWIPLNKTKSVFKWVFTNKDWLTHQNYDLMSINTIKKLIDWQRNKQILYSNELLHDEFIEILNTFTKDFKEDKIDIDTI